MSSTHLKLANVAGSTPALATIERNSGRFPVLPLAFPGGVGNTWGDTAKFQTLLNGVEEKIYDALSDETWIYPGHGGDTTLGEQRPHLQEWRERKW